MNIFFDAKNAKDLRGKEEDWIFIDFAAFFKPFASLRLCVKYFQSEKTR